ncbi:protein indeterminate-domain 16-like [Impatiens glandulifera]|uniref:protein indeterminate-domain 16-like n=1 Tax=Impatiens glandulifera TaxID=253017 RepID=UPI001FB1484E|nr:protein indeterminate-domain 16-like [Impatiens glandulifera]
MDHDHRELQFFRPTSSSSSTRIPPWQTAATPIQPPLKFRSPPSSPSDPFEMGPSLDLQLSICVRAPSKKRPPRPANRDPLSVEALRWQAAEQIQLAAAEKAYAERVREMTRREMELARSEFTRAKRVWERAREEVERAELMKEKATRRVDSSCMEITCHSCRHKFRPVN